MRLTAEIYAPQLARPELGGRRAFRLGKLLGRAKMPRQVIRAMKQLPPPLSPMVI